MLQKVFTNVLLFLSITLGFLIYSANAQYYDYEVSESTLSDPTILGYPNQGSSQNDVVSFQSLGPTLFDNSGYSYSARDRRMGLMESSPSDSQPMAVVPKTSESGIAAALNSLQNFGSEVVAPTYSEQPLGPPLAQISLNAALIATQPGPEVNEIDDEYAPELIEPAPVRVEPISAVAVNPNLQDLPTSNYNENAISVNAAVISTREVGFREYDNSRNAAAGGAPAVPAKPTNVYIEGQVNPINLVYNSLSSPVNVQLNHRGTVGSLKKTESIDDAHHHVHTVTKPVISELHEIISPVRKVKQEILPVMEKIKTYISKSVQPPQERPPKASFLQKIIHDSSKPIPAATLPGPVNFSGSLNGQLNGPLNGLLNGPLNGPLNSPLNGPLNSQFSGPKLLGTNFQPQEHHLQGPHLRPILLPGPFLGQQGQNKLNIGGKPPNAISATFPLPGPGPLPASVPFFPQQQNGQFRHNNQNQAPFIISDTPFPPEGPQNQRNNILFSASQFYPKMINKREDIPVRGLRPNRDRSESNRHHNQPSPQASASNRNLSMEEQIDKAIDFMLEEKQDYHNKHGNLFVPRKDNL